MDTSYAGSYLSLHAMREDLGGNYAYAAEKDGRFWPVKDVSGIPRNKHTIYHSKAAEALGYRIHKIRKSTRGLPR